MTMLDYVLMVSLMTRVIHGSIYDKSMSGQSVIRVTPQTEHQLRNVSSVLDGLGNNVDIWKGPSSVNSSIDFRLTSADIARVTPILEDIGLNITIQIHDVVKLIKRQARQRERMLRRKNIEFHKTYHTFDEISGWIDRMVSQFPGKVSSFNIGTSYLNRPQRVIKISTDNTIITRQAIWIHGGGHAREWISPATVMYIAEQMLTLYDPNEYIRSVVDQFDWYFLPVYNPDGYSHTWTSSRARLWRKSRRTITSRCTGVDLNRNWDGFWGRGDGSSGDPCSDTYRGSVPFSEPETRNVENFLQSLNNVVGFIDFHSFGQFWLVPYSYSSARPPNFDEHSQVSSMVMDALSRSRGTGYEYGNSPDKLYPASGVSADWAYDKKGIVHSYIVELPDTGRNGFLLPSSQIIPVGNEALDGIIEFAAIMTSSGRTIIDLDREPPPNVGQS